MHPIPTPETVALDPRGKISKETSFLLACLSDGMNQFLDRDAGEDGLVHQNGGEHIPVSGQDFLEKGGATSWGGDDKDGLADFLPAKARIKEVVQCPSDGHDDPKQGEEGQEKCDNHPTTQLKGFTEIGKIQGFCEEVEIEVHEGILVFLVEIHVASMQTL
jgi:hypothetical protein